MTRLDLLNTDELAEELGLTSRSLERWRQTGEGPEYLKIGRSVRYELEVVRNWLRSKESGSTSEHCVIEHS